MGTGEKKQPSYSWYLKRQIAIEYLNGNKTLSELSISYDVPHQSISRWSKDYAADQKKRTGRILSADMNAEDQKHYEVLKQENELLKKQLASVQQQHLQEENAVLKKELEFSQMKALAMETIIDLAKEEYGIDLRKNSGARQPVRSGKTTRKQK